MEVIDFKGCFEFEGRRSDEMTLRVIVSKSGGETVGSGSFSLPLMLVGLPSGAEVSFFPNEGGEIRVLIREIDESDGVGYFLTSGDVARSRRSA